MAVEKPIKVRVVHASDIEGEPLQLSKDEREFTLIVFDDCDDEPSLLVSPPLVSSPMASPLDPPLDPPPVGPGVVAYVVAAAMLSLVCTLAGLIYLLVYWPWR